VKEAATISAFTPTHGYAPTRQAAMAPFAKSRRWNMRL